MTDWANALDEAWNALEDIAPVSRQYRSRLISWEISLDIRAGMRAADDAPCLMVQASLAPDALFELSGMRLSLEPDQQGTFLILSLEDRSRRDLFLAICADVVAAAAGADREDALRDFLARLAAWRLFLRDRREGLSRPETVGLIGELVVLERLLDGNRHCLAAWQAPSDGLHDFDSTGHALEVKTGLGPSSTITISKLDQLDVAGLRRLDLLHVKLVEAPSGRSLRDLIGAIRDLLPDDASRRTFENDLLRRGLLPDDEKARTRPAALVRAIEAYNVSSTFPRLVRQTLPVAITEATYTLEVRALSAFAADMAAVLDAFHQGESA